MGKLLVYLFSEVYQGHARALYACLAADAGGIAEYGVKLFKRWTGDYRRVGEYHKLAVGWDVGGRNVAQHSARTQQSVLLVEYGV